MYLLQMYQEILNSAVVVAHFPLERNLLDNLGPFVCKT